MQYCAVLTVPYGTPAAAPVTLAVPVCAGLLRRYVVFFPAGQAGLVRVQVWYADRQVLPTSLGEAYRGDDLLIDLPDAYPLPDSPYELLLVGWAPSTVYNHDVIFTFYVEREISLVQESLVEPLLPGELLLEELFA